MDDVTINFLAKDEKESNDWIDGFNILMGRNIRTETFREDLNTLVEMDCVLQLIELQNVKLPSVPPIVPPLPSVPVPPPRTSKAFKSQKSLIATTP